MTFRVRELRCAEPADATALVPAPAPVPATREDLELRIAAGERALHASLRELDDFGYALDHDLRAPLRAVSGFGKILQEDYAQSLDQGGQELLTRLLEGAGRMTRMLNDLVELSRLGRSAFRRSRFDLGNLAHEVAAEIAQRYPARQVQFEIQPDLPVNGDRELLKTVLVQLLDNAVKFTGPRATARIQVGSCLLAGERAWFVADNGVGFAPEGAPRIFGTFRRLHSAVEFPGSGVGLAAVARIIARHDGRVWAESHPEHGTRVLFTLGHGPAGAG